MNAIDRAIWESLNGAAFPKNMKDQLGDASAIGLAGLALDPKTSLIRALQKSATEETRIHTMLYLLADDDDAADEVDRRIEAGDFDVLNDLVRFGIGWDHERLADALDDKNARFAAGWLLADVDPDRLIDWLDAADDAASVVEALRGPALLGMANFFEPTMDLRERASGDSKVTSAIDALLACMDPVRTARRMLKDDLPNDWLRKRSGMADFVHATGTRYWNTALALLDAADHSDPFELAACFAACSGTAVSAGNDKTMKAVLQFLEGDLNARTLSSRPELGMVAALDDDDDTLVDLLAEVAVHEFLTANDGTSPGIMGLPFSSSENEDDVIEACATLLAEAAEKENLPEEMMVQTLQTLVDAANWVDVRDLSGIAEPAYDLMDHRSKAISTAARDLLRRMGEETSFGGLNQTLDALCMPAEDVTLPHSDNLAGLAIIDRLSEAGESGIPGLVSWWFDGPLVRADLAADALREVSKSVT